VKRGESAKAALEHLVYYPSLEKSSYPTILALHGRGANQHDLIPLIEALELDDTLVVSARAPMSFGLGGLGSGYAWYEIGEEGKPDPATFQPSYELLKRFLDEVREAYPVDRDQLMLLGFSQGTVMAYAVGLTKPSEVRGIAALSGYVPSRSSLPLHLQDLNGLSIFISHGEWDELIPVELGRESAEILKKAGAKVAYHEYLMGHEVRPETLRDLSSWLRNILH
jgi:phospholipase/carboxylesterase